MRRAPDVRATLIAVVDDATKQLLSAQLWPAETTAAVFSALHAVFTIWGLPIALHTDRARWAFYTPKAGGPVDRRHLTQVGRALERLGILTDSEYAAQPALERLGSVASVVWDERLHLATPMRSFRSEKVSAFVNAVLDCDKAAARVLLCEVAPRYPVAVTRDLGRAKAWIRAHARGSERYGLVASSQAQGLKPHAIDVDV